MYSPYFDQEVLDMLNSAVANSTSPYPSPLPSPLPSPPPSFPSLVKTPPYIVSQPRSETVNQNDAVTFSVIATGENLRYQWYKDDVPIKDANQPTLTLYMVMPIMEGMYSCLVENEYGSVMSQKVYLKVNSFAKNGIIGKKIPILEIIFYVTILLTIN